MIVFAACSVTKQTQTQQPEKPAFLNNEIFIPAHVGVAVYDPAANNYLYNYQADKYFIPASNTKIFTCYAAMKNLGDSLTGLLYTQEDSNYTVKFTGDPTLLHPDFKQHNVADFFKIHNSITVVKSDFKDVRWGNGWAWNDYDADYMAERSAAPVYGNVITFKKTGIQLNVVPKLFKDSVTIFGNLQSGNFSIERDYYNNNFSLQNSSRKFTATDIPFITSEVLAVALLEDSLKKSIDYLDADAVNKTAWQKLKSQPTDSMLAPMMHRSDNFYAEQTLLMISNEKLGLMNDNKIIDTLLKTDFAGLPQKPRWVDGSGLSRYNLITPMDFVWVLNQMKKEFNWKRITTIFSTGGSGTLNSYFKDYAGKIYAKTGTLSGQVALSGFITAKSGKELIFSVLVNNHQTSASNIRRAVEAFLIDVMEKN
jgi:D-alanyl-D-alanine carboxypeptidase/D-alanyl-D-alanine-endopeptidase (penicillin-binding protein 4)